MHTSPGVREGFTTDQVAAGEVSDGERIAVAPIGEHELALVIMAGAALAAMLGVSLELAVSNQGDTNGNVVLALRDSAQDTTNQVGQEITRRNLSVQPTLTVRPGFPMDTMVNKDLPLRPYQPLFFQKGPLQ